jgi:hypothetical protein
MDIMNSSTSGNFIATFPKIDPKEIQQSDDVFVKINYGQRIDTLAFDYLGDGGYWWVLCLLNGFATPFEPEIVAGKVIRIPSSLGYVLSVLERKSQQNDR